MAFAYTVRDQGAVHFITFTVHQWADVFTRQVYVDELLSSIQYYQAHKGLRTCILWTNGCKTCLEQVWLSASGSQNR